MVPGCDACNCCRYLESDSEEVSREGRAVRNEVESPFGPLLCEVTHFLVFKTLT
jgi:hypothetical protein